MSDDGALRLEAQRLEDLRLSAFEDRIEADLALGQDAELIDELEGLVGEYPYRERLWRQLMLALYRAERQADALAAYRRARGRPRRRARPRARRGAAAPRTGDPASRGPAGPTAGGTPQPSRPVSSFVGRESELADVDRLLRTGRLVTLSGVGGVGKTRLALEAASRAIGESPDGVFLVDLSALTERASVDRQVVDRPRHPGAAGRPARPSSSSRDCTTRTC